MQGIDHPEHRYTFASKELYEAWKTEYQEKELVKFIKHKCSTAKNIKCLRCHRSKVCGAIVAPMSEGDTREREEQFTGLSKINDVCTCGLVVTYHESQVEVRLYPRHYIMRLIIIIRSTYHCLKVL